MRNDRSEEYYGRYTEDGQVSGPFAKFLQDNEIVVQCTMSGSPDQNGVAERKNQTLIDMVQSMLIVALSYLNYYGLKLLK